MVEKLALRAYALAMYCVLFVFTTLFAYCTSAYKRRNKRIHMLIFGLITILLPCIFAGLRAETVGTDVLVYAKPVFSRAVQSSSLSRLCDRSDLEIGYLFLAYITSRISSSLSLFLFLTELLCFVPVFIVAYRRDHVVPLWITILVYLLLFYGSTLNVMRQSIAASLLLLAYQRFEDGHRFKALILVIVGSLFHKSMWIGILFYVVVALVLRNRLKKNNSYFWLLFIAAVAVFSVVLLNADKVAYYISALPIPSEYLSYLNLLRTFRTSNSYLLVLSSTFYADAAFRVLFIPLTLYSAGAKYRFREYGNKINKYILTVLLCEAIYLIMYIVMHTSYGYRLTLYGEYLLLLLIPLTVTPMKISNWKLAMPKEGLAWATTLVLYFVIIYFVFSLHTIWPLEFSV